MVLVLFILIFNCVNRYFKFFYFEISPVPESVSFFNCKFYFYSNKLIQYNQNEQEEKFDWPSSRDEDDDDRGGRYGRDQDRGNDRNDRGNDRGFNRAHNNRGRGQGHRGQSNRGHSDRGHSDRGHSDRGHNDRGHNDRGQNDRGQNDRGHNDRGHNDRRSGNNDNKWKNDKFASPNNERNRDDFRRDRQLKMPRKWHFLTTEINLNIL